MPLFSYVWQYSNQPINQLAQDINELIAGNINQYVIPVSNGLAFVNSNLVNTPEKLETRAWVASDGVSRWGMEFNHSIKEILIGDSYCNLQLHTEYAAMGLVAVPYNLTGQSAIMLVNGNTSKMQTLFGGDSGYEAGFNMDYGNDLYEFGVYNMVGSNPKLKVDSNSNNVSMQIQDGSQTYNLGLNIDGIYANTLTSGTSGGTAGTFMEINVNGTPYKLELHNI